MGDSALRLRTASLYSVYVLALLLLAYLLNQLDRYTLPIVTKPMAQDIHYGDIICMINSSYSGAETDGVTCNSTSQSECVAETNVNGSHVCEWNYNGQGYEYQLIAGPIFIVIYTFVGIPLGILADRYNRKVMLAVCLMFWSAMTFLMGFVTSYWQLVLLRFGLGIGEAGCTPFAASLIADYFTEDLRGSALGVYNWGIYIGYSLSYAIGNFITNANILGQGWRWTYYLSGAPGLILGIVILATVKEPERKKNRDENAEQERLLEGPDYMPWWKKLYAIAKPFGSPSLLILCLAGSIRNAGGYVWAYNTQPYFEAAGQTPQQIGAFMSWIPLVAGSLGVVLGGFISDRFVKKRGPYARVFVLVASQLLASPFAAGALFLPTPWAYISLIPANVLGEMWIGVTLAVALELVPSRIRTSAIAFYLFIITNIGGNFPLLVPPLQSAFQRDGLSRKNSLRAALFILYPGMFMAGGLLFLVTLFVLRRDIRKVRQYTSLNEETEALVADTGDDPKVS